jgi:hypothetical protein
MEVTRMLWLAAGLVFMVQFALGGGGWALCKSRGHGKTGFVLGFMLGPIGLMVAAALPRKPGYLRVRLPPICPKCYEVLAPDAPQCDRCGSKLSGTH